MILGFSHLTLRCRDIDEATRRLEAWGYRLDFQEAALINPEGKRPFLSPWCDRMNIAFFRAPGALPIELVEYPTCTIQSPSVIEPILAAPPTDAPGAGGDMIGRAISEYLKFDSPALLEPTDFETAVWRIPSTDQRSGIVGLLHRTAAFEDAVRMWERVVGRKAVSRAETETRMAFAAYVSPVASLSLRVIVLEDPRFESRVSNLDAPGVTCLSFACSSVARDHKIVDPENRQPTTGGFEITINNNRLQLEIILAQPGLFFELLEKRPTP